MKLGAKALGFSCKRASGAQLLQALLQPKPQRPEVVSFIRLARASAASAREPFAEQMNPLRSEQASDKGRLVDLISSWRQLDQVGLSCVKLILLGLFCPLVWQEFTEGLPVVLVL